MPNENNKILKYNPGEKCIRVPFVIYVDLECLLEKICTCSNNPKNLSATKINKHTLSGYSLFTDSSFDATKNKLDYYRGQDYMKKVCETLKEHLERTINCKKKKKKEMIPLTDEENESCLKQEVCHICKKRFITDDGYKMVVDRVRDHCHYTGKYRGATHKNCSLANKVLKEIPIVFHNGSAYDYHFIIKELAKEFKGQFECSGKNAEKYITFSVKINKKITKLAMIRLRLYITG